MLTVRLSRLVAAVALTSSFTASVALAACDPENWKECEGKPWVIGKAETPIGEKWWPNEQWGAGDEAGSTNWYTKAGVVMRAVKEADKGKVYQLGRSYTADMPLLAGRTFALHLQGNPTNGPFGANQVLFHAEFLATEVGQVGTQFDGLGHAGVQIGKPGEENSKRYYNGFTENETVTPYGLSKLGVEKLNPIVARGILLDIAGLKGVESMQAGEEIAMADVKAALKRQGMERFKFMPGDGVFFRTGWGKYWNDEAKTNSGAPGIGMEVALWLSDGVQVGVVGADSWPTEVVPNPDPACGFCVHSHLITRHGIVNQENMDLDELARDKVYTFMYVYSPAPIVGATGSMGAPVAID